MNTHVPEVSIELGGEERKLLLTLYASKLIADKIDNVEDAPVYEALPVMLWAMLQHEGKDETPEDISKLIGPGNLEYVAAKIAEAQGQKADPTTAKVNGVAHPTGGNSKPSRKRNSASRPNASGA